MSASDILKQFKGQIRSLPATFRQNMKDIREADSKVNRLLEDIQRDIKKLVREKKVTDEVARQMVYNKSKERFDELKRLSDEKCRIAHENYELIDKHVNKLDSELAKLRQKQQGSTASDDLNPKSRKRKNTRDAEQEPSRKKQKNVRAHQDAEAGVSLEPIPLVDMPVDEFEPTYCLCQQVSYGEMIGCDNKDCPIEWFHFQCVNLTTKPRGKWFCPQCYPLIKNKKQASGRKTDV